MSAAMGGLDALVFTGGVGERSAPIRVLAVDGLAFLGLRIDATRNDAQNRTARSAPQGQIEGRVTVRPKGPTVAASRKKGLGSKHVKDGVEDADRQRREGGRMTSVSKQEILAAESSAWSEIHGLIDSMTPAEAGKPGYYPEGWSAKDALGHIGAWLAEAGMVLEQISADSYRPNEIDIDALNATFLDSMREVPFDDTRAQAMAARTRMLQTLRALPEVTEEALRWVRKSGPEHYQEHLPRLREWIRELRP